MTQWRIITPEQFEAARLAFVAGWEAENDRLRPGQRPERLGGQRSAAGLRAALARLGITTTTDEGRPDA